MPTSGEDDRVRLIDPTERLHRSWLEAREEWGRGEHQAGSGLWMAEHLDVDTPAGFSAWLDLLRREVDTSVPPEPGKVHANYWWIAPSRATAACSRTSTGPAPYASAATGST